MATTYDQVPVHVAHHHVDDVLVKTVDNALWKALKHAGLEYTVTPRIQWLRPHNAAKRAHFSDWPTLTMPSNILGFCWEGNAQNERLSPTLHIRTNLSAADAAYVSVHELGHAIDGRNGKLKSMNERQREDSANAFAFDVLGYKPQWLGSSFTSKDVDSAIAEAERIRRDTAARVRSAPAPGREWRSWVDSQVAKSDDYLAALQEYGIELDRVQKILERAPLKAGLIAPMLAAGGPSAIRNKTISITELQRCVRQLRTVR